MGDGVALRGLRPRWRLRRPRHIGSLCDALELRAPCHARLLARSGAAAVGRSGHCQWQRAELSDRLSRPLDIGPSRAKRRPPSVRLEARHPRVEDESARHIPGLDSG